MPRPLIGHCIAPADTKQVVVASGYSPDLDDYTDLVDIYNMDTGEWYTKPWAKMQFGPRIDASCYALRFDRTVKVIVAGGWSNLGVMASEMLDVETLRWDTIGDNSTGSMVHALPYAVRSSTFIELDNKGILVAGVKCTGTEHSRQDCNRSSKILKLTIPDKNEPTAATWDEFDDLLQPRSSHGVLVIPSVYVSNSPKCKKIP